MRTRTCALFTIFLLVAAVIFIFTSCDNGGEVSNTITIGASEPGEYETSFVFTFDADGVPQKYKIGWKIKGDESGAAAAYILETMTAWRGGIGYFDHRFSSLVWYWVLTSWSLRWPFSRPKLRTIFYTSGGRLLGLIT